MVTVQANEMVLDPETRRKLSDLAYSDVPLTLELIEDVSLSLFVLFCRLGHWPTPENLRDLLKQKKIVIPSIPPTAKDERSRQARVSRH
jgi:hypothetical protein